jgi:adenylate kinase
MRRASGDRVLANQQVLLTMFEQSVAAHTGRLVVFDGHLIIDTDAELIEIPLEVIAGLRPAVLVHVEAPPEIIVERRRQDRDWFLLEPGPISSGPAALPAFAAVPG